MIYQNKPKQRFFIFLLFTILIFAGCNKKSVESLPNIIIIFADDLGYGDLGSYGATDFSTPHLDQMAAEGMRFTNFYSAQAVCSASRAALLTGCYPNRIGISGALMPWSTTGLHENELTIAELLKNKGYSTGIVGKWHLGWQEPFLPLQHGFDAYFGLPYSNDMWPVGYDGNPVTEQSLKPWKANYPKLPLIENNEIVDTIHNLDDQAQLTTRYTDYAVDFINQHKNEPFFLYFAHTMPHVPLGVSEKFKGKSTQGMYGDVIMEIDWSVGQIFEALKNIGQENNTLVIFTSDNGPWLNFGNHAGSSGGLREGKGTSWEGGQREPCVMWWPGNIPSGKICNKLSSTIDLLPTIASITEAKLSANKIDGVNILPLLQGVESANPRDHFYFYYQKNSLEGVRKGAWKLVLPHNYRSYELVLPENDGFAGPYAVGTTDTALFNLVRDPGERYDVKDQYPEIVNELFQLVEDAREDLGDQLTERIGKNIRPVGKIDLID